MSVLPPSLTAYAAELRENAPLAKYTAARLGGAAEWLYVARGESMAECVAVISAAWAADVPVRVIGGGANILIADEGIRGLVIVNHATGITFTGDHGVEVSSGVGLIALARKCMQQGLAGFEWAVSVPGTIGGAVVNNAGAHGGDMAGCVRSVEIVDAERGHHTLDAADLAYAYRSSVLKYRADRRFLVLSAKLQLSAGDPVAIEAKMNANVAHRKQTQPPGASLGSIFKNPPNDYAGRLIEACGLKGFRVGGAQVSPLHANFFINDGSATAADYYALILEVQERVHTQTGVALHLEIETVGFGNAHNRFVDAE